ncbi:hypothetical protein BJF82_08455 [Kytococcus sp. CUA-901]|nr:hypothetical protein BJF82_08455 [Kytococcus sp. CUA-901]
MGADMVFEYSTVINGFSADLTEKQVAALKARGDVVSVTPVRIERLLDGPAVPSAFSANKPQTDVSRDVIGLTGENGLWNQVGGKAEAGKGQVVAVIDSGITPDNPSFSDEGMPQAPPPGTASARPATTPPAGRPTSATTSSSARARTSTR